MNLDTVFFYLGRNETNEVDLQIVRMSLLNRDILGVESTVGWKIYFVQPSRISSAKVCSNASDAGAKA